MPTLMPSTLVPTRSVGTNRSYWKVEVHSPGAESVPELPVLGLQRAVLADHADRGLAGHARAPGTSPLAGLASIRTAKR